MVRTRGDSARLARITANDLWGNNPRLTVAVGSNGRLLSLPWQFGLMRGLLSGKMLLFGPRASLAPVQFNPLLSHDLVGFWQDEPGAPGLTGAWAKAVHSGQQDHTSAVEVAADGVSLFSFIKQLWCDPGGFGVVGHADTAEGTQDQAPGGQEVS